MNAYNTRVEHTRLGVERVDSGVDTELSNTTGQHSGGVQVSEGGSRGGIRQIIGRDVDGLHGRNGALLGRGNTLLPIMDALDTRRKENCWRTYMPPMSVDKVGW